MTAKEQGLPPLPTIPAGPLYQAIIIDGDCTEEFVEYVRAYALAALASDTGGRGVVDLADIGLSLIGCASIIERHSPEISGVLRSHAAALRAQPDGVSK